ncbi:hypothetical protein [Rhizobium lusitanum]|uniref:Uncharacterized protein n=1 Tax=Rhizobium lusitanum TaxID=293958 RepID=A0A7X0IMW1_9HYPH|nr:hypothetical protein [Rhizobium lusitanum]MBB6483919.1 hypothetical protein [Rhizobium lusitanum]
MNRVLLTAIIAATLSGCVSPNPVSTTSDGYRIQKFSQGTVSVGKSANLLAAGNWSVSCQTDAMTGKRNCSITSLAGALFIDYGSSPKPQRVCALLHDAPGMTALIRVDSHPAVATDTQGCVSASRIIHQMRSGSTFLARVGAINDWSPDLRSVIKDSRASLEGLNKAMETVADIQAGRLAVKP